MKQHITTEQLNELSEKGKERLKRQWYPEQWETVFDTEDRVTALVYAVVEFGVILGGGSFQFRENLLPLLSIGQMIELLDEDKGDIDLWLIMNNWGVSVHKGLFGDKDFDKKVALEKGELCDALWSAVREILEKE